MSNRYNPLHNPHYIDIVVHTDEPYPHKTVMRFRPREEGPIDLNRLRKGLGAGDMWKLEEVIERKTGRHIWK